MTSIHIPVSGHFILLVQKMLSNGRIKTVKKHRFDNLITDFGLNSMASVGIAANRTPIINSVQVGGGSNAPDPGNTALQSHIATTSAIIGTVDNGVVTGQYHWCRWSWRFGQGVAAGNISEIGVGINTAPGSLFSRALILDGNGTPVTLTILPNEFLTVVYELRNYPPTGDVTRTRTIDGVQRTITIRPHGRWLIPDAWRNNMPSVAFYHDLSGSYFGHTASGSDLVAENDVVANELPGPSRDSGRLTLAPYVSGSFQLDMTSVFGIAEGNVAGGIIRTVVLNTNIGSFQMGISPGVAKDSTKSFTVSTRISWGRYTP